MKVSVEELKRSLGEHENAIHLDVRTPGEYEKGKLGGSINLPVQEVGDRIEQVVPDKNKKIYVYCLSGSRSAIAVEELKDKGYINVFDVEVGLLTWSTKKYPTTQ